MTLVETLLAVAITALVLGLIYSIYNTAFRVVSDQQTRIQGPVAAMHSLEEVSQALACSLSTFDAENKELYVLEQDRNMSRLSFLTATPEDVADLQWYDIQRTTFHVPTKGDEQGALLRLNQPITGPGAERPSTTNVLVRNVKSFDVQLFDGTEWVKEWPNPQGPDIPQAARLALELDSGGHQKTFETEVFIPVGNVMTSRIETVAAE